MTTLKKFSAITVSSSPLAKVDYLLGVRSGTDDVLYPQSFAARQPLQADQIYYVRTDGSPTGNGLANTAASAFDNVTTAISYLSRYVDGCGFSAVITVADGNYTIPAYSVPAMTGFTTVFIIGNVANNQAVHFTTAADIILFQWQNPTCSFWFQHVKFSNTFVSAVFGLGVYQCNSVVLTNIYWGTFSAACNILSATSCSQIVCQGTHDVNVVNCAKLAYTADVGFITFEPGSIVNFIGTPAAANAWFTAEASGVIRTIGATFTNGAAATGLTGVLQVGGNFDVYTSIGILPGDGFVYKVDGTGIYRTQAGLTNVATVATLGTAFFKGSRMFVTDSTVTLAAGLGNVVVGGGGNYVPVYDDGTDWRIG